MRFVDSMLYLTAVGLLITNSVDDGMEMEVNKLRRCLKHEHAQKVLRFVRLSEG
jgi:hypothetical protein